MRLWLFILLAGKTPSGGALTGYLRKERDSLFVAPLLGNDY